MASFIDKLKTQLGGYFAKEEDLAPIATTGDYNDLINTPQGGGGGGFTPYVLKISKNILENQIDQVTDMYNNYLEQTNQEIDDATQFLLYFYNIGGEWDFNNMEFFAVLGGYTRCYPYKVKNDYVNNFYEIYFYNLPEGSIELHSIPNVLKNIEFEIVDGVYEYQYIDPTSDPGAGK